MCWLRWALSTVFVAVVVDRAIHRAAIRLHTHYARQEP